MKKIKKPEEAKKEGYSKIALLLLSYLKQGKDGGEIVSYVFQKNFFTEGGEQLPLLWLNKDLLNAWKQYAKSGDNKTSYTFSAGYCKVEGTTLKLLQKTGKALERPDEVRKTFRVLFGEKYSADIVDSLESVDLESETNFLKFDITSLINEGKEILSLIENTYLSVYEEIDDSLYKKYQDFSKKQQSGLSPVLSGDEIDEIAAVIEKLDFAQIFFLKDKDNVNLWLLTASDDIAFAKKMPVDSQPDNLAELNTLWEKVNETNSFILKVIGYINTDKKFSSFVSTVKMANPDKLDNPDVKYPTMDFLEPLNETLGRVSASASITESELEKLTAEVNELKSSGSGSTVKSSEISFEDQITSKDFSKLYALVDRVKKTQETEDQSL